MGENYNIAIVEDDKMFAKRMSIELKKNGYQNSQIFEDGMSFLMRLPLLTEKPDIIILDYKLDPSMNGLSVLKEIQNMKMEPKIIMVSGQTEIKIATEAIKKGAYDYFEKDENTFWRVVNAINKISERTRLLNVQKKKNIILTIILFSVLFTGIVCFYFFNLKFKII